MRVGGEFVHLVFGALNGAIYGALIEINPRLRAGGGVPFGIAVWALADEAIVPALGLSRSPRDASIELHAYSAASHAIFDATTEFVREALRSR